MRKLNDRPLKTPAMFALFASIAVSTASGAPSASEIDALVEEKLAAMSVEDKVGQMTQITLGILSDDDADDGRSIDPDKLAEAIHEYRVGSILNTMGRSLSLEEWHGVIRTIQDEALSTANEIPVLYGIDAIHGANYTVGSTLFPHNIGLAASRDRELVARIAAVTAKEVRASGIRWNFDPVLDVGRNPLWPRFEETFGEDVWLVGQLGAAAITAYERNALDSPVAVATSMKHFLGYSDPENGKDRTPAFIPEVELREHHVPSFAAGIDAGASTVMINSGSLNGMPVHGSKWLLTDLLRGELGFEGVVVSDWEDVIRLHTRHRIAATPREAVRLAVEAGIDISMVPNDYSFPELLTELVRSGEVEEARIDRSVTRILRLKYALGLFDNAYPEPEAVGNFADPAYRELALDAARATITLLDNTGGALPLPDGARLLVAGPAAENLGALHGSWSYTWQGDDEGAYPEGAKTLAAAAVERFGVGNVVVMAEANFAAAGNYDGVRLRTLAADVDAIVLALGEPAYAESPGVIDDLALPAEQVELAESAIATGKPVVLVLLEGRPRVLGDIIQGAAGIVQAYRPGSRGAQAIIEVLAGDHNPSGVLPYTYPRHTGDLLTYDRRASADVQQLTPGQVTRAGYNPAWPFGHGLGYTEFEYGELELDKTVLRNGERLAVSVAVRNTGNRDADKAVDLYVSDQFSSLAPAVRRLKRFDKVFIGAGESVTVQFGLNPDDLAFVNADLQRVVEPGAFTIHVGDKQAEFDYVDP